MKYVQGWWPLYPAGWESEKELAFLKGQENSLSLANFGNQAGDSLSINMGLWGQHMWVFLFLFFVKKMLKEEKGEGAGERNEQTNSIY